MMKSKSKLYFVFDYSFSGNIPKIGLLYISILENQLFSSYSRCLSCLLGVECWRFFPFFGRGDEGDSKRMSQQIGSQRKYNFLNRILFGYSNFHIHF